MEYNSNSNRPFNQPILYGYSDQDLRLNEQGNHAPWEIMNNGSIDLGLIGPQEHIDIADQKNGAAVSKALTYYHRPRDWQEHPNFFNPYWHAKLHPFSQSEAAEVLLGSGRTDEAAIVGAIGMDTASTFQAMH
jgi:hypothetical protein